MESKDKKILHKVRQFNREQFKELQTEFAKLQNNLIKRKELIIKHRLNELGIEIDFEKDFNPEIRFKRFVFERNGNEETLWYNDGSATGLRVVTFVRELAQPTEMENPFSVFQEITYTYY